MKRCLKCERRIGFLPYLFGIRICEDCELELLKEYKNLLEKKKMMEEDPEEYLKIYCYKDYYERKCPNCKKIRIFIKDETKRLEETKEFHKTNKSMPLYAYRDCLKCPNCDFYI